MARQAQAALALAGAHHSSWRGQLGETRKVPEGIVLGTADWDGTLRYHYDEVVKPLQEMFARRGEQLDAETLVRYRSALLVVLHENAHMLAPEGRDNGDERDTPITTDPARKALEEGATEAWAVRNLDRYIDELGLADVCPGLKQVKEISRYQHYLPAADVLAERLGEGSAAGRDEVLRQLNCVLSDGKWPVLVDAMYKNSELPDLVPQGDQRRVKRELDAAMRAPMRLLKTLETKLPISSRASGSRALGEAAYFEGLRAVERLENQYRSASAPLLHQDRAAEQPQPSNHQDYKDVIVKAFSGTADPTGAITHPPAHPAPVSSTRPPQQPQKSTGRDPR
ncbi:hypothetical protein [Kribbella sp. NPDC023855]|uniref:hypothetical protein n=1 Tax=Kribbella sp. NPDC023855 TaxID=3154698 RepID=UPI0033C1816F